MRAPRGITWFWLPLIGLPVAAVIALIVAGAQPMAVRTFALEAPNQLSVAELRPTARVCEGPVTSPSAIRGVAIWGAAAGGPARLTVDVEDPATATTLASGPLSATPAVGEWRAQLNRTIAGGRPLQICLTDDVNAFVLSGSGPVAPGVVMHTRLIGAEPPSPAGHQFSLVLLSDMNRSLLSSLGTAFSRASLWRPSWLGSWTFWVLTLALLAAFGAAVAAVVAATAAEDPRDPPPGGDGPGDDDMPPPPRAEAGQAQRSAAFR